MSQIRFWVFFYVILWFVAGCTRPKEELTFDLDFDEEKIESDFSGFVELLDSMCIDPEKKMTNYEWFRIHGGIDE